MSLPVLHFYHKVWRVPYHTLYHKHKLVRVSPKTPSENPEPFPLTGKTFFFIGNVHNL